jgi:hypothetical protein
MDPACPCGQQPSRAGWTDEVIPLAGGPEKIIAVDLVPPRPEAVKRLGASVTAMAVPVESPDGWAEEQRGCLERVLQLTSKSWLPPRRVRHP